MKKRLTSFLLALIMLAQLCPTSIFAAEDDGKEQYTVRGQIYAPNKDGEEEPVDGKSTVFIVPDEEQNTGVRADVWLENSDGKQVSEKDAYPETAAAWKYLWCYSTEYPKVLSLDYMIPASMGEKWWSEFKSKNADDLERALYSEIAVENPMLLCCSAREITGHESDPEMLYLACFAFCGSTPGASTSGFVSPCFPASYASQNPVTDFSGKLIYVDSNGRPLDDAAGKNYQVLPTAASSLITASVSGVTTPENLQYLWFYGTENVAVSATPDLEKMTPVGMKPADWQTALSDTAPETYLLNNDEIWAKSSPYLPVKTVSQITDGDTTVIEGAADNSLAFTCALRWNYSNEQTLFAVTPGSVRVDFSAPIPMLDEGYMRSGGVSAADSKKSIALTAALKNYSGTPVWQFLSGLEYHSSTVLSRDSPSS